MQRPAARLAFLSPRARVHLLSMPLEITQLTVASFAPLVGEGFALRTNTGNEIGVRLAKVQGHGWHTPPEAGGRQSFSLVFHAPASERLAQGIHAFTHPTLGTHELFLVPIGRDAQGLQLEVIFNFA